MDRISSNVAAMSKDELITFWLPKVNVINKILDVTQIFIQISHKLLICSNIQI